MGIVASASDANATVIFDNFDIGGGFHPTDNLVAAAVTNDPFPGAIHAVRAAAQFSVTGGHFSLASITLPINVQNSPPGNFLRVRLTSDAGGAPGTTLEVLSENQGIWPQFSNPFTTTTTLSSATHPPLLDGQAYWIVTEPTSIPPGEPVLIDYRWFISVSGPSVPIRQQQAVDELPSDPWDGFSSALNLAFRVEGTPGIVAVSEPLVSGSDFELGAPCPNPAASNVTFDFRLGAASAVSCDVFDIVGRRVVNLLARHELPAGEHHVKWNGDDVSGQRASPGVYLVRFSAGAATAVRRFALVD